MFFRKLKRVLIKENRFTKYLLYAVGEILLVVIGILIALEINNANEVHKNREITNTYLENLVKEIDYNIYIFENAFVNRYDVKMKGLYLARAIYEENIEIIDTTEAVKSLGLGGVYATGIAEPGNSIFTSLNNTGNIRLLDFELRTAILDYYTDLKLAHQMSKDQLSGYNLLMNSLRPYNPETPDSTTAYSRKYVLEKAKTEEFYQTANLEISSANHNLRRIKNIIAQGENLIKMIENRLKE
ncbi:DUF6090 family protein [Leeuwenhoekiella sp. A16]|uniref:DUF6090 family protein n=1 Tax=unclassified Leeuwenhoekiella TaxID=2615029 RepID=UPI003A8000A2